jgi:DNA-binding CsgD family transcriptional regulator
MKRIIALAGIAIALFAILIVVETVQGNEPFTISGLAADVFEKALLALAIAATAYVALETKSMQRERVDLLNDLARVHGESDKWRSAARAHVDGLSQAMGEQFKAWRLTESEADVALLILKGLTHKEIAQLRGSEEATVRQQAAAVYRKAGLAGRAELGAYFLDDLLAPATERRGAQPHSLEIVKTDRQS